MSFKRKSSNYNNTRKRKRKVKRGGLFGIGPIGMGSFLVPAMKTAAMYPNKKRKVKRGGIGPVALAIPAVVKAATMLGLKTAAKAIATTGAALAMKKIANMKRNSKLN